MQIPGELDITVKIDSRKISHRLKGQLIIDTVEQKPTFLTNERVLVIPYRVQLGKKTHISYLGKI